MSNESVPIAQYHLARAYETLQLHNRAVQHLRRVWKGPVSEMPLNEVDCNWMSAVDDGEKDVTERLIKDVLKSVNKREKELELSRQEGLQSWESSTVRDFEHSASDDALSAAKRRLKDAHDALQ